MKTEALNNEFEIRFQSSRKPNNWAQKECAVLMSLRLPKTNKYDSRLYILPTETLVKQADALAATVDTLQVGKNPMQDRTLACLRLIKRLQTLVKIVKNIEKTTIEMTDNFIAKRCMTSSMVTVLEVA
jgi:hypothetical protein